MREIRTSGLMSGDGKRSDADMAQATAPVLDFTIVRRRLTRLPPFSSVFPRACFAEDRANCGMRRR